MMPREHGNARGNAAVCEYFENLESVIIPCFDAFSSENYPSILKKQSSIYLEKLM
jgi:hypothetical protein